LLQYNPEEVNMRVRPSRVLAQGVIAGVLGYLIIVLAYAVLNLIEGRPVFATAAHLGARLAGGPAAAGGGIDPAPVIAFNGVHLLMMLLVGVGASWLVNEWEAHPLAGYLIFFVAVVALVVGSFWTAILVAEFAHAVSWVAVLTINTVAAVAMAAYLLIEHPAVRRQLAQIGNA
jgi:hypothetical protein